MVKPFKNHVLKIIPIPKQRDILHFGMIIKTFIIKGLTTQLNYLLDGNYLIIRMRYHEKKKFWQY